MKTVDGCDQGKAGSFDFGGGYDAAATLDKSASFDAVDARTRTYDSCGADTAAASGKAASFEARARTFDAIGNGRPTTSDSEGLEKSVSFDEGPVEEMTFEVVAGEAAPSDVDLESSDDEAETDEVGEAAVNPCDYGGRKSQSFDILTGSCDAPISLDPCRRGKSKTFDCGQHAETRRNGDHAETRRNGEHAEMRRNGDHAETRRHGGDCRKAEAACAAPRRRSSFLKDLRSSIEVPPANPERALPVVN